MTASKQERQEQWAFAARQFNRANDPRLAKVPGTDSYVDKGEYAAFVTELAEHGETIRGWADDLPELRAEYMDDKTRVSIRKMTAEEKGASPAYQARKHQKAREDDALAAAYQNAVLNGLPSAPQAHAKPKQKLAEPAAV